jgi:hypothetical protein
LQLNNAIPQPMQFWILLSLGSYFFTPMLNRNTFVPSLFALIVIACKKEKTPLLPETPEMKEVEYRVFAARDYSDPVFQSIDVDLRLQVRIINYKTGDTKLVWDSVFSTRKLTDFPPSAGATIVKKNFPVLNSHEKLNGSYSVRYTDNGMISQEAASDEAGPGTRSILLEAAM